MDPTEDLSARILLKHILVTEPPRTPVTRSKNQEQSSSGVRRSNRLRNKDADAQTPQSILRRSLKQKIREGITRKSLPATKLTAASVVLKNIQTPNAASVILSDGDTPRRLLRNILQTEPVKSPVIHKKRPSEEQDLPSDDKTLTRTRSSIELSGLDLPDVTISHAASTAKGLSRKRPRRSLNVTAFENRLQDDAEEEADDNLTSDHSSISLSSSTSLSLKTPFVDVQTEKRGLVRRVSNRRKITEEEFGAAVKRREMGEASSYARVERDLSETTHSEGFTLGLSKLSEPDITTDIVNCNTALYDLPDAMTSNISIVATQDKPTVTVSQLQQEMDEERDVELKTEMSVLESPTEKEAVAEPMSNECVSEAQLQEDGGESEPKNKKDHNQQENAAVTSTSEEEGDAVGAQTVDTDNRAESEEVEAPTEEEWAADSHSEKAVETNDEYEAEQVALDSQTKEDEGSAASATTNSQSEVVDEDFQSDKQDISPDSQTEEVEGSGKSQMENGIAYSQSQDVETGSQSDEEEVALAEEEEGAVESQSEDVAADSQSEDVEVESQSEEDEAVAESQSEDDNCQETKMEEEERVSEQLEHHMEHVSRRAHRSEGVLVVPITEAGEESATASATGWSDSTPKAHICVDLNTSRERRSLESSQRHTGNLDGTLVSMEEQEEVSFLENDSKSGKENLFHLQMTEDIEVNGDLDNLSPEHPAQNAEKGEWEEDDGDDDDEGEEEEEEGDEFPSKTPAFVREKRNFFLPDPQKSPSVIRNIQTSSTTEAAAKPRQVRQRKTRPSMKKTVLPKTYLMSVFKQFAKTKVSADVYPVLNEIMDKFFDRLADDLETYAIHAKRKTIEIEDAILLLKRQGYVNDKMPVEALIEKYLRMEQRKLLIPIATSGNVVIPKRRL